MKWYAIRIRGTDCSLSNRAQRYTGYRKEKRDMYEIIAIPVNYASRTI